MPVEASLTGTERYYCVMALPKVRPFRIFESFVYFIDFTEYLFFPFVYFADISIA